MNEAPQVTLANYILHRLAEIGIYHVFGVPGDYNLTMLDAVDRFSTTIKWLGNCNELDAAYAADGYARIHGIAALITTAGVGELSALNGLAGSFAEKVAIIHIVGKPQTIVQEKKLPNHHTLGDGIYDHFTHLHNEITCAQLTINKPDPDIGTKIDKIIATCYLHQRPVVIGVADDLFNYLIDAPKKAFEFKLPNHPKVLQHLTNEIVTQIKTAKNPVAIIDGRYRNYQLAPYIKQFIEATNIPYATTMMTKGFLDESHPRFLGLYFGKYSSPSLIDYIEESDCILWFGYFDTDLNSGKYTTIHDKTRFIVIQYNQVVMFDNNYPAIDGVKLVDNLTQKLGDYTCLSNMIPRTQNIPSSQIVDNNGAITSDSFWQYMHYVIKPHSNVLLDAGTSLFGIYDVLLAKDIMMINQMNWASIGYSIGATLGVMATQNNPNTYVFVGDGAFQATAQEVSNIMYNKFNPIIFLINNNGYTIERYYRDTIHYYNDIPQWDYCGVVKNFGGNCKTWKVTTLSELKQCASELELHEDKLRFVEVIFDENDAPALVHQMFNK